MLVHNRGSCTLWGSERTLPYLRCTIAHERQHPQAGQGNEEPKLLELGDSDQATHVRAQCPHPSKRKSFMLASAANILKRKTNSCLVYLGELPVD